MELSAQAVLAANESEPRGGASEVCCQSQSISIKYERQEINGANNARKRKCRSAFSVHAVLCDGLWPIGPASGDHGERLRR